jgi:hypothetical protein
MTPFSRNGSANLEFQLKIHKDSGKEFVNKLASEMMELLNISHTRTLPAHPQCNAQVEVFNKTMKKYLHHLLMTLL